MTRKTLGGAAHRKQLVAELIAVVPLQVVTWSRHRLMDSSCESPVYHDSLILTLGWLARCRAMGTCILQDLLRGSVGAAMLCSARKERRCAHPLPSKFFRGYRECKRGCRRMGGLSGKRGPWLRGPGLRGNTAGQPSSPITRRRLKLGLCHFKSARLRCGWIS